MEDVDFEIFDKTADEIGGELCHSLVKKGYCVLKMDLLDHLDYALDNVREMRSNGRFSTPPPQLVDGLLGVEGSGAYAEMRPVVWDDSGTSNALAASPDGEAITALIQDFSYMAQIVRPFFDQLGYEQVNITNTYVLQGGERDFLEEGAELTEETCTHWTSTFMNAKLVMLYFMGPGSHVLKLQPYDDESGEVKIRTTPDMLIIARCDLIQHSITDACSDDYTLINWLVTPPDTGPRGWTGGRNCTEQMDKLPAVRELVEWAECKLRDLCSDDLETGRSDDVPRVWQRLMRTSYMGQQNVPVAVRGVATHSPSTDSPEKLWKILTQGPDLLREVPLSRWDHSVYYSPEPNSFLRSTIYQPRPWAGGFGSQTVTNIKHFCHIDGVDLFDARMFQISRSEAESMEPQQRHVLETSYEALYRTGYRKKTLLNNYIGVYTGNTYPEAAYIPFTSAVCSMGMTSAILANRTSFVLGLHGPSTSIDSEQASSAMAIQVAVASVAPNNGWTLNAGGYTEAAVCSGVYIGMCPYMWPRSNAFMNPDGRCRTFDDSAQGYVPGESCTSMGLKAYFEKTSDGELTVASEDALSTIIGVRATSNGSNASLTTVSAPAIQECVTESLRQARIGALDMDAVECHGSGLLLEDWVETVSMTKVLRYQEEAADHQLILGAVKTNLGSSDSATGMSSYMKVIYNIIYACNVPCIHLHQLNGHVQFGHYGDATCDNFLVNTDCMPYKERDVFHSWSSRARGGMNTSIVSWWLADSELVNQGLPEGFERETFPWWPAGGGYHERGLIAMHGYYIVGSWNNWEKGDMMVKVGEGIYSFKVTMGPNNFETFQVWVDGEHDRILHPGVSEAGSGTRVYGPSTCYDGAIVSNYWMIGSRSIPWQKHSAEAEDSETIEPYARDTGQPGYVYEIRFESLGKYQSMSWTKVNIQPSVTEVQTAFYSGVYHLRGSCNNYGMTEMETSDSELGLHSIEIRVGYRETVEFQIVRNKDWDQIFHPLVPTTIFDTEVQGPHEGGHGIYWMLTNSKHQGGATYSIDFRRVLDDNTERKSIECRLLDDLPPAVGSG